MIDNKDFDFVKEKFDADGIETPESLSAENMMRMLENESRNEAEAETKAAGTAEHEAASAGPARKTVNPMKRRWFRPVVSVAACVALVVSLVPFINSISKQTEPTASYGELQYFSSYDELSGKIKSMNDQSGPIVYNKEDDMLSATSEATDTIGSAEESLAAVPNSAQASDQPASHSETYTQVEGVDEADIVKTDGKYIYFSSYEENQIIIARTSKGKAKRVAAIGSSKIGNYIEDMYLTDGKLIVIGSDTKKDKRYTTATVFDVSDPEHPSSLHQYAQSGDLLSSRLIGDNLCLVTNDYIYIKRTRVFVPYVYYDTEPQKLPIGDICCFPEATSPAYTVVGCMDISSGKADKDSIKTKAVLGGSSEIYCNDENLYITANVTKYNDNDYYWARSDMETSILKVSIKDGDVKYQKTAVVKGTVNNQFSMDETDGYFKVAVTTYEDDADANTLYVFDKNMKEVGCVRNFAPGEHIEAVRYIKDKAYVITYEETDPLFIIDLADPTNPVIEGHVKITGFSTLLVPAADDYLLGIGFSTEDLDDPDIDMEATNGMKFSLFDISNPSKPTVADAKAFVGMDSEVQYNHKALLVGPDASYYGVPFYEYSELEDDEDDYTETYGILTLQVKDGKLKGFQKHETKGSVMRCIYIGDYIYGICDDDSIEGFQMK